MEGPDRGYSWVVVVCCAYIHFALFGIFRSAGIMYVAILQSYDVTREEASWAFALAAGVFQIISPVTIIVTHYISQRKACLLGSFIATVGVASCYFADSIMWINISYGIVHGFGFGILATLITVTLNQYFVKYRATAIGIAFAGGSLSSLVFPLVMEWLLHNYSLNESFLLLSGVVMNTLVASSLLRAPPWMKKSKCIRLESTYEVRDSGLSLSVDHNIEAKHCATSPGYHLAPQAVPEDSDIDEYASAQATKVDISINENKVSGNNPNNSKKESPLDGKNNCDTVCSNDDSVLFNGSYSRLNTNTNAGENSRDSKPGEGEFELKKSLLSDKNVTIVPKKKNEDSYTKSKRITRTHSLTSVLKQPLFYQLAITMCVYFLGVHSTFMVIIDFAKDKGIPEDKGVYIISMFSLTDLIGRAGLGWVTDHNYIKRKDMVCLSLAILGVSYNLYPFIDVLPGILAISAIQGLAVGCSITLFFVIQAESMGLKNLTLVVGLTSCINGIASFLRPGIIGLFRDVIGSYNLMFHAIGAVNMIFAFMWLIDSYRTKNTIPPTAYCDEKA